MELLRSLTDLSSFSTTNMVVAVLGLLVVGAGVWYVYRTFFQQKKSAPATPMYDVSEVHASHDGSSDSSGGGAQQTQQESSASYYSEPSSYQQLPPNLPVPPGPVYSEQPSQNDEAP